MKQMQTIRVFQFLLLIVCLGATSCKTANLISRSSRNRIPVREIEKWHSERNDELHSVWIKKIGGSFIWNNQVQSFKASYRIKRDSIILISLMNPLGIEAVRIFCTVDTFGFIDRINRNYYREDYSALQKKIGLQVNYYLIQALLLNEIPNIYSKQVHDIFNGEKSLVVRNNTCETKYVRNERDQHGIDKPTNYLIVFDADFFHVKRTRITRNDEKQVVDLQYKNHDYSIPAYFPEVIEMEIEASQLSLHCDLKLDKIQVNTEFNTRVVINPNYTRIDW
jgi:hypothetical protein